MELYYKNLTLLKTTILMKTRTKGNFEYGIVYSDGKCDLIILPPSHEIPQSNYQLYWYQLGDKGFKITQVI